MYKFCKFVMSCFSLLHMTLMVTHMYTYVGFSLTGVYGVSQSTAVNFWELLCQSFSYNIDWMPFLSAS